MTEPTTQPEEQTPGGADQYALAEGTSLWKDAWRRLFQNRAAVAGLFIVIFMAVVALLYPLISTYVTRFTFDEQHHAYEPKPIGARSVPMHNPSLMDPEDAPFASVDANKDGQIDRMELSTFMAQMEFSRFDEDGDKFLSPAELEDAPINLIRDSGAATHKVFDINGDGKVDFAEARGGKAEIVKMLPDGESRAFIRKYDTNKDRKLSPDEFKGVPEPQTHFFGTDQLGRDLLTRVMQGARVSLMVGLVATLVSFLIGVMWGATAGFLGGKVDNIMMRIVDVMYGLPFMFLVILLMVIFQEMPASAKLYLLFVALGAVQWLTMSRIVRGQVIGLKHREFVEAARCIGVRKRTIIVRHLIPNALGPIIVYATLTVPAVMLREAFLSFLGLGVQAPFASWGSLAAEGAQDLGHPWLIIFPGAALAATLLSLNFLGDGLRDALDPQVRKD
jgi:oligopeptide transport system permease protein